MAFGVSYPIWNEVTACIYRSGKSYGAKDTSSVTVKVGSSAKNSHELCEHHVTNRYHDHVTFKGVEYHDVVVFSFGVDGIVLKRKIFKAKPNSETAGELIKTLTVLTRMKGL